MDALTSNEEIVEKCPQEVVHHRVDEKDIELHCFFDATQ